MFNGEIKKFSLCPLFPLAPQETGLKPLRLLVLGYSLSIKVYRGRREPILSVERSKRRINRVWNDAANDEHVKMHYATQGMGTSRNGRKRWANCV